MISEQQRRNVYVAAEHAVTAYPRRSGFSFNSLSYYSADSVRRADQTTFACCVGVRGETETQYLVHYQYRYGIGGWLVVMPKTQLEQIASMTTAQMESVGVVCYEYAPRFRWFGRGRRFQLKKKFGMKADEAALIAAEKLVF